MEGIEETPGIQPMRIRYLSWVSQGFQVAAVLRQEGTYGEMFFSVDDVCGHHGWSSWRSDETSDFFAWVDRVVRHDPSYIAEKLCLGYPVQILEAESIKSLSREITEARRMKFITKQKARSMWESLHSCCGLCDLRDWMNEWDEVVGFSSLVSTTFGYETFKAHLPGLWDPTRRTQYRCDEFSVNPD